MQHLKTFLPKETKLLKYIACYYFQDVSSVHYIDKFHYFPHYNTALTLHKGSEIKWSEDYRSTLPSDESKISSVLTLPHKMTKSIEVKLSGRINKIGIVFHPLGLNHFINEPLNRIFKGVINNFDHFGNDGDELYKKLFNTKSFEEQIGLLDGHFIKKLSFPQISPLEKAVELILCNDKSWSISNLEIITNTHRKTLLRYFQTNLGCSIKSYQRIVRFRKALNQFAGTIEKPSLTELALKNNYFDQSYFNKEFKRFCGKSPKDLLPQLIKMGEEEIYWFFPKS